MLWLPNGEKNLKIRLLVLTEFTNVTDRRTDRQTDRQTPHDGIGCTCIASSFFLLWGGTRSFRMPALRPASQAGCKVRTTAWMTPIVYWMCYLLTCSFCEIFDLLLDVCACLEFIDSGMFSCGSGDIF